MDKTVVVKIVKTILHPVFKKYIKKTKKLYAEDADNKCKVGDKVEVVECRPISKTKRWKVFSILTEQKGA
jgi:small subunit ribosomal protein S17